MEREWWTSPVAVNALANALCNAGFFGDMVTSSPERACKKMLDYFDRPWNWQRHWEHFKKHGTMEGFEGQG